MKNLIYTALVAATILLGCREQNDSIENSTANSIVIEVTPSETRGDSGVSASTDSKAIEVGSDALNENKIQNLHVLIFSAGATDNSTCLYYQAISGLSFQGTGTLSQQLSIAKSFFTLGATYDVYTIANLPSNITLVQGITLGALKSLKTITPIVSNAAQNNFVMDGKSSVVLNPTSLTPIVYIDMPLSRAVSKIRVHLQVDPLSAMAGSTTAQVSLVNFAEVGSLLGVNAATLAAVDYDSSPYVTATPSTVFTFYCYQNNWATNPSQETYLMVNLPYGSSATNYYRVPINKYANNVQTGRLDRNMIYDVTVYLDKIGTPTISGALTVNGNFTITDWTTRQIVLQTVNQHYLGISEYSIVMPNIASYTINYVSDLAISITGVTAGCVQYSTTGATSAVTYTAAQAQFPTFVVNSAASTITINSAVPVNYVPKNIAFTVTNNQGLSLQTVIVQYPARYVTARPSTGNIKPEWNTGGTNLNLFTVNTLVPSSNGSYTLGDPTNGFARTDSTASGNKMVSPRFIIASQYGVYLNVNYPTAQNRCYLYGEDTYRSGWRLPTKSEIELINVIQDDPLSAVKALLSGNAYWSAYKYNYYDFTNNAWTSVNSNGTAFVRCVYDLYKDEL